MRHRIPTDKGELEEIIRSCMVCHLAMADTDGIPYVVPMNFGYEDETIFLHGAAAGMKIDILKRNPEVCIEFSTDYELRFQSEKVGCSYTMKYRSVIARGRAEFIEGNSEKARIMGIIMNKYASGFFTFSPPSIQEVCCWQVRVRKMEGRINGY